MSAAAAVRGGGGGGRGNFSHHFPVPIRVVRDGGASGVAKEPFHIAFPYPCMTVAVGERGVMEELFTLLSRIYPCRPRQRGRGELCTLLSHTNSYRMHQEGG